MNHLSQESNFLILYFQYFTKIELYIFSAKVHVLHLNIHVLLKEVTLYCKGLKFELHVSIFH